MVVVMEGVMILVVVQHIKILYMIIDSRGEGNGKGSGMGNGYGWGQGDGKGDSAGHGYGRGDGCQHAGGASHFVFLGTHGCFPPEFRQPLRAGERSCGKGT